MSRQYNFEIMEAIRNFLDEDDWNYNFENEIGVFRFNLQIRGNIKDLRYLIYVKEHDYVVYASSPLSADEENSEQMAKMAEFICRANYGLRDGNFEMDFNDGEIRYKCYMNCNGVLPTKKMVGSSIFCPAAMFERYNKGILQILFFDMSAADAVSMCENAPEYPDSDDDEEEVDTSRLLEMLEGLQRETEDSEDSKDSEDSDEDMPASTDK